MGKSGASAATGRHGHIGVERSALFSGRAFLRKARPFILAFYNPIKQIRRNTDDLAAIEMIR